MLFYEVLREKTFMYRPPELYFPRPHEADEE